MSDLIPTEVAEALLTGRLPVWDLVATPTGVVEAAVGRITWHGTHPRAAVERALAILREDVRFDYSCLALRVHLKARHDCHVDP